MKVIKTVDIDVDVYTNTYETELGKMLSWLLKSCENKTEKSRATIL